MRARFVLSLTVLSLLLSGCFAGKSVVQLAHRPKARSAAAPKGAVSTLASDAPIRITWIGHASMLVQIGDKNLLTDPVFTSTVGQVSKRLVEPGLRPEQLPPIDAVLISHMHFDHLSLGSLDRIEDKVTRLFVPRGGVAYLPDYRFDIRELDRWETFEDAELRISAVPVAHVGFRYGVDQAWMRESFTGYVIEYQGHSVYFAGDTAYAGDLFRQTQARFPNLEVALLPIAPETPKEFMKRTHVDASFALQAFLDLGATAMVPMHYDTFVNSADRAGAPLAHLEQQRALRKIAKERVVVLGVGESHSFE